MLKLGCILVEHKDNVSFEMFQVIDDKRLLNYLLPFYSMLQQKHWYNYRKLKIL